MADDWREGVAASAPKTPLLSQQHIEAIASRKWKSVLAWIAFHPDELILVDKKNQTALHHACLFRAPAQIIEMLLFQAPQLADVANVDGEVALHWAVRLSAPNECLKLLLSASPKSGLAARDREGNTPLSLLWDRHQEGLLNAWWESRERLLSLHSWRRVMFFFRSYYYNSSSWEQADAGGSKVSPLHIVSRCPCPPAFYPLLLNVFKDEIKKTADDTGMLPLAIACTDPVSNRATDVKTKILMLVEEWPEAAQREIDDGTGRRRLPIHLALESGVTWDEGVSALFALDPSCLAGHDPVSGLLPFLLAACGARNRQIRSQMDGYDKDSCDENSTVDRSLTTVYMLLRSDPARAKPNIL